MLDIYQQPFVLVDRQFTIVASNKAYADQYNLTPEDIIGCKCHKVSHHSDVPCIEIGEDCPHRRMFKSGKVEEALHVHTRPDGSKDCVEIKAHPIRGEDGKILYMGEHLRPIETHDMLDKSELVGRSEPFLNAIREANVLAPSVLPVLVTGESGKSGYSSLVAPYLPLKKRRKECLGMIVERPTPPWALRPALV